MNVLRRISASFAVLALLATLTSCSGSRVSTPVAGTATFQGKVFGGQQPITDATIQLYAVNTTTDGGTATPLLTTTVTTSDGSGVANANANSGNGNNTFSPGYFTLTGFYTCPAPDTLVFLTASGGNPGLTDGTNNSAIQSLAALGSCSNLQNNVQFLAINEVTTVGAVAALYPYMTAFNAIGSTSGHASDLTAAFQLANEYVNFQNGQAPGPSLPAGFEASTEDLNALANVIAGCVNTEGGTYNDGSACGNLFLYSYPGSGPTRTDIIGALLDIRNHPTNNVTEIFNLQPPVSPFNPVPATPPSDYTLPILAEPGTPTFSPGAGTYSTPQNVTISDSDTNAVIYYTTDGSTPTTTSSVYSTPVSVSGQTLKALAVESGRVFSAVGSAIYTVPPTAATPTFSPVAGSYSSAQVVTITSTPGATIYYTTDGSTPTTSSLVYQAPVTLSSTQTLNAIGVDTGYLNSAVGTAAYTIPGSGFLSAFAGNGSITYCCDGEQATVAVFSGMQGIALDSAGNIYISDTGNQRIRKIDTSGVVSTIAGTGTLGYGADGTAASLAAVSSPTGITVDSSGNIYFNDSGNARIRKINASDGKINTIIGTGTTGYSADGTAGTSAKIGATILQLALDASGNLLFADNSSYCVRIFTGGVVNTLAGICGSSGAGADNQLATATKLSNPRGIVLDASGDLYIADGGNYVVRKVDHTSLMASVYAGTLGSNGNTGDGSAATSAKLSATLYGVALDAAGNLYISDGTNSKVRKVTVADGKINTIAGTGVSGFSGDGGLATAAQISAAYGLTVDSSGNVFFSDYTAKRIRKINGSDGKIHTIAGASTTGWGGDGGPAVNASMNAPSGVVSDRNGNIYITDYNTSTVRKVNTSGVITTVVGTGSSAYNGDGIAATTAQLNAPTQTAVDASGNLYIAEYNTNRIRKVDATTGLISTIAGTGNGGNFGDTGLATSATLANPQGVAVDSSGNVYISDTGNCRIRKITIADGKINAFAGSTCGYAEGSAITTAKFSGQRQIWVDSAGTVYVADSGNHRVRKVVSGTTSLLAGTGVAGNAGDNGAATSATMDTPVGVITDSAGNVYITDDIYNRVRKITISTGKISNFAGSSAGSSGSTGDGGAATSGTFGTPYAMAIDPSGNYYIADYGNRRVRKIAK